MENQNHSSSQFKSTMEVQSNFYDKWLLTNYWGGRSNLKFMDIRRQIKYLARGEMQNWSY